MTDEQWPAGHADPAGNPAEMMLGREEELDVRVVAEALLSQAVCVVQSNRIYL